MLPERKQVLIVDDEPNLRKIPSAQLSRAGYDVMTANDGEEGLAALKDHHIDLVITDPPFFDNVHYSELADFFHIWQRHLLGPEDGRSTETTRSVREVQSRDPGLFADRLRDVFAECNRVLRRGGLLVFTYHHSRPEGWKSLADAVWGAGFQIVNAHPVKAEMSVATPKFQAKEPIQLDMILVCRKRYNRAATSPTAPTAPSDALDRARAKLRRLADVGFTLSRNDRRITLIGQLLASVEPGASLDAITALVDRALDDDSFSPPPAVRRSAQLSLF